MEVNGARWDRLLKIKTSGRDDSLSDYYHYPYEPTPYEVLERLAGSGYIRKQNTLVDYGCGKGRVSFYFAYQTRCHSIGIDFNEKVLERAIANQQTGVSAMRTAFFRQSAERYPVPVEADRFYFFNPFSGEILRAVLERLKESYYEKPREMILFFYYISDTFQSLMETEDCLSLVDQIDCQDLFDGGNERERVWVYRLL